MYNFTEMDCRFTVEEIRDKTREVLADVNKSWNELQIDILVQGVENSDWLKLPEAEEEHLEGEIREWIDMLEEEWKERKEFGF